MRKMYSTPKTEGKITIFINLLHCFMFMMAPVCIRGFICFNTFRFVIYTYHIGIAYLYSVCCNPIGKTTKIKMDKKLNLHMSKFMCDCESSTNSIVFNDGAASTRVTHCPQFCQSCKIM